MPSAKAITNALIGILLIVAIVGVSAEASVGSVTIASFGTIQSNSPSAPNLCTNGDFHLGWQYWDGVGYGISTYASVDTSVYHSASAPQSARLSYDPSWPSTIYSNGGEASQIYGGCAGSTWNPKGGGISIPQGMYVVTRVWIKTSANGINYQSGDRANPSGPKCGMDFRDLSGNIFYDIGGDAPAQSIPWNTDWTLVQYTFGPCPRNAVGTLWVCNGDQPNHNYAWFADCEVYVLASAQSAPPVGG